MTYPNAGEMARVVVDPDQADGHSNISKQVFCKGVRDPQTVAEAVIQGKYGVLMEVQALQPIWGKTVESPYKRVRLNAGDWAVVPRNHLSRIDPPAGTDELYKAEPKPVTLDECFQALGKLIDEVFEGAKNAPSR